MTQLIAPQIDLQAVYQAERRFLAKFNYWTNVALKTAENQVHEHVQNYSKFKRRSASHSLKDAARGRHFGNAYSRVIRFQSYSDGRDYEQSIEYGARPHVIRARRAPRLVFFWPKVGRWMYLRKVNHPGNKPYKFLWNAHYSAARVFSETMTHGLEIASRSF